MPLDAVRLHARYNGGSQTCAAERFRYYMGETPPRLGLYRVKPATNKEFLVSAGHNPAEISLLLFVHTARRSYRLGCGLSCLGMPIHAPSPLRAGPLPGLFPALNSRSSHVPGEPPSGPGLFDLIPRGSLMANSRPRVGVAETNVVPEIGDMETVLVHGCV